MSDASNTLTSRRCIICMIRWLSALQSGFESEDEASGKRRGKEGRDAGESRRHGTQPETSGDGVDGAGEQTEDETHGGRENGRRVRRGRREEGSQTV